MIAQLLLFLTSIALGGVLGILYAILLGIARSTKLKAMIYIFDIIWCVIAFVCFAVLTMWLGNGAFEMFTVVGILAGIGISTLIFMRINQFHSAKKACQVSNPNR